MAVGDLYNIVVNQSLASQDVQNSYFYEQTVAASSGTAVDAVASAFATDVLPSLSAVQSTSLGYETLYITNLDNPAEFGLVPFVGFGSVASESLPPFAAWGFQYVRTTRAVHNGSKRIGGIPESMQIDGSPTTAADLLLIAAANALGGSMTDPVSAATFVPKIYHRPTIAHPAPARYPVAFVVRTGITTQNTRKFGHGS